MMTNDEKMNFIKQNICYEIRTILNNKSEITMIVYNDFDIDEKNQVVKYLYAPYIGNLRDIRNKNQDDNEFLNNDSNYRYININDIYYMERG